MKIHRCVNIIYYIYQWVGFTTESEMYYHVIRTSVVIQTFNSTVCVTLSNWQILPRKDFIVTDIGIITDAVAMCTSSIMNVLMPTIILSLPCCGRSTKSKIKKNPEKSDLYQDEANRVFSGIYFSLLKGYTKILHIWFTCLYFYPIYPLSVLMALIGITAIYWCHKYLLLKKFRIPKYMHAKVCSHVFKYAKGANFFVAFGYLMQETMLYGKLTLIPQIMLIISWIFVLQPVHSIFFKEAKKHDKLKGTYLENKPHFFTEYDRTNPITALKANQQYIEYLEQLLTTNIDKDKRQAYQHQLKIAKQIDYSENPLKFIDMEYNSLINTTIQDYQAHQIYSSGVYQLFGYDFIDNQDK